MKNKAIGDPLHFYIRLGWGVIVLALGGFLLWATLAPLDQGVQAEGVVKISGNSKTVQSQVAGKISSIAIAEGERVAASQLLISLDKTQTLAQLTALEERFVTAGAITARLQAEHGNLPEIAFPDELTALTTSKPELSAILRLQENLLDSRRSALREEAEASQKSIDGLQAQLTGLEHAAASRKRQLQSFSEQLGNLDRLAREGYLPRHRYLETERDFQNLQGIQQQAQGQSSQLRHQIAEALKNRAFRQAEYQKEVRSQLTQAQVEMADYRSQLTAVKIELNNMDIRSPLAGNIVGLKVFTRGGVVSVGEALMDVVPLHRELEVEARLPVNLIDKVAEGAEVELLFSAFNQNKTPVVKGSVAVVSADRLTDQRTGSAYYTMRVIVPQAEIQKLQDNRILPGMPVSVFVKTGERSLLNYLFRPLVDRAHLSLTEE